MGEHILRDAERLLEITETAGPEERFAYDQERPPISEALRATARRSSSSGRIDFASPKQLHKETLIVHAPSR